MNLSIEDALRIEKFSLEGLNTRALITSVYDGDSVHAVFPFADKMYRWVCRLDGIDTPEVRTKNEDEKRFGFYVRDALRERILYKEVDVSCGEFDKYGRLLVVISMDGENINSWLISKGYANVYDGGTKVPFTSFFESPQFT
tara:strand:- start:77 stop:502 length:426 start_codon:yes stop_codon:yes gene_type:complete